MALNLATNLVVNETIDSIKINLFTVDLEAKEIHVVYSELSGATILKEKIVTITEPEFTATITNASTEAGADIYSPLKNSLYDQIIQQNPELSGTVV